MRQRKTVAVVGAGVSGLTAAICCARKGHKVIVFEQGLTAGGVSTSWNRKGYHFEGGIHWLVGSTPRLGSIHKRWKEVGALQENNPITFRDPVYVYRCGDVNLSLWRNIDRLESEMLEFAPEDAKAIHRFATDIRQALAIFCRPGSAKDFFTMLFRAPAFVLKFPGILGKSTEEYCEIFSNPHLRALVSSTVDPKQNAISLIYTMATYAGGDNGYPKGGSITMVGNMLEKARKLGVELRFRSRVERVRVKDGRAAGIESNGEFFPADDVIVAADTVQALDSMFEVPLKEKWIKQLQFFKDPQTCTFLSLGVESGLEDWPEALRLEPRNRSDIGMDWHGPLMISVYKGTETGYAPAGCSALTVILFGNNYDFWKAAKDVGNYKETKQMVAERVISIIESELPALNGKIKVIDLATPLTYERYCGNYRGAWMSMWHKGVRPVSVPRTCKTVKGLHFAGFRTQLSGGLPVALNSGYKAAAGV